MLQEQFIIFDVESTRLQKSDKSRCHRNSTITNKLRLNFASVSTHVSYSSHNFVRRCLVQGELSLTQKLQ